MPIQIGICDDREEHIKALSEALLAYDTSFHITDYIDGESMVEDCIEQKILFDIIFLDIYMPPGPNGIEIAHRIRSVMQDVKIIFVSSSDEHYQDAYNVFAFNYLIKPVEAKRLNHVLDHALIHIQKDRYQQIQFSYKSINYRIFCKDILFIESNDKVVYFHTKDNTILKCYAKLDEIMTQLPEESFIRCHQSYIVNLQHVTEMTESHFQVDMYVINISRKYKKESKDKYFEYLFKHMSDKG